jgi:hypothetical protein
MAWVIDCEKTPLRHRRICPMHRARLRDHGTTEDPRAPISHHDIDIAVEDRRPNPGLTAPERRTASCQFTANGLSAREIARVLCVNDRTITGYRKADRTARAEPVPVSGARTRLAAPPVPPGVSPGPVRPARARARSGRRTTALWIFLSLLVSVPAGAVLSLGLLDACQYCRRRL